MTCNEVVIRQLSDANRDVETFFHEIDVAICQCDIQRHVRGKLSAKLALDNEAVAATIEKTIARFGRLDAVFANAGVLGEFKPLAVTDADDFDVLVGTNLRGTFFTIKHCLPFLEGGNILINASWTAGGVMPGAGAYASTKGALLAMMRTFAVEQGPRNIRINAINPGIILTPMAGDVIDPAFAARLAAHTPLRRNGTSEDVAGTVAWCFPKMPASSPGKRLPLMAAIR
jgi:NAD(P)-dependent dehydrogenase (short-subunit alcohol dehydrogenase family)